MPNQPPTLREEVTTLKAEVATLKLQIRATLNSMQVMAQNMDTLTTVNHALNRRIDTVDKTWRDALIRSAAQTVMAFYDDDGQPTQEDVWEVDEWKIGETLKFRTEDVVVP